jgi:hypothetical protein
MPPVSVASISETLKTASVPLKIPEAPAFLFRKKCFVKIACV